MSMPTHCPNHRNKKLYRETVGRRKWRKCPEGDYSIAEDAPPEVVLRTIGQPVDQLPLRNLEVR